MSRPVMQPPLPLPDWVPPHLLDVPPERARLKQQQRRHIVQPDSRLGDASMSFLQIAQQFEGGRLTKTRIEQIYRGACLKCLILLAERGYTPVDLFPDD